MALTLDQVATIIIEASQTEIPPKEDPTSVDFKSRNLIFALKYHQDIFDPIKTEENAKKLIEIIKCKFSMSLLNPAI
ncbi:MAG: hypothetical protein UW80_C0045G0008 [Microgenomates group bacterium GW2011_GWC1_44_9]|nr:MAG: hypothetical protein UW80_C0045G0008 [Microgenomates group bacterium GW2011_GWC1_44_9]